MADYPIIAYDNVMSTASVVLRKGELDSASSLDRLWDGDLLRPTFFQPDAALKVELELRPVSSINCCVLGADRNDSAGQLVGVGGVTMTSFSTGYGYGAGGYGASGYGGFDQISTQNFTITTTQTSKLLRFNTTCSLLVVSFTGCDSRVAIPEIFIGESIEMPLVEYGYDPYNEITNVSLFTAESGREYARLRYRRVELNPQWGHIPQSMWDTIDTFRERAIELRAPFWFAWSPTTYPDKIYFVRHVDAGAPFPIQRALSRKFALKLQEVI